MSIAFSDKEGMEPHRLKEAILLNPKVDTPHNPRGAIPHKQVLFQPRGATPNPSKADTPSLKEDTQGSKVDTNNLPLGATPLHNKRATPLRRLELLEGILLQLELCPHKVHNNFFLYRICICFLHL